MERNKVVSVASEPNIPSKIKNDSIGMKGEATGVGGSNPSHRTNLPATMTPAWLAKDMISLADIGFSHSILEPSAGTGSILDQLFFYPKITAIELNKSLYFSLKEKYVNINVLNGDFITYHYLPYFGRILMNPPHRNCVDHVKKAYELLDINGRIVALIHATYLPEIEKIIPSHVRKYGLPRETFCYNDSYIEAAIIVIDK